MKKNLEVVALGLGLLSLAFGAGCHEQEVTAEEIPTFVQVEAPKKADASGAKADEPTATPNASAQPADPQAAQPPAPAPASAPVISAAQIGKPPTNLAPTAVMPDDLKTSPALTELIRLLQGGVSEDVLMAFITNSTEPFYIGADEILFLHDLGTPTPIITTLIQRDSAPDMVAKKHFAAAVQPLPPGMTLTTPATNIYAANAPAPTPPEPTPVNPPVAEPSPPTEGVVYGPEPEPVNVNYFYSELAPYGAWVSVSGYGHCWRPTVAVWNGSWRPYGDCGRWLWTDAGWYWYSDYSWGWAPFHYGRWACPAGVGWVWVPDTCWGPSWVSWRYSSSYCGWAPLPPSACWVAGVGFCHNNVAVGFGFEFGLHSSDYVFVSSGALTSHHPTYLSSSHSASVFKDTTVANNYVTVNNTKVVNKGVGFERISHATRGNVRQVALKDTTDVRSTTPRRETLDPDGKTLSVSRPPLTASASAGASAVPTTTKGAPTHVNVHPRAERNVASLAPNTASSSSGSDSLQPSSFTGTVTPRGTYLSPRISPSPAVKPSTVTTPTTAKPDLNSAPGNSAAPRNGVPIRGGYTRGGRPDAPAAGGNTVDTPNTGPRPSPGRSEPGPVRGTPGPVRPGSSGGAPAYGAPSVNHAAPSVRPSISSPRVEAYRAPAPAPAAPAPATAAPAAPAARSAPAPAASPSSGGRGGGGTDGGGGRGSR